MARWSVSRRSFRANPRSAAGREAGDLTRAMAIQSRIDPLKDAVYGDGRADRGGPRQYESCHGRRRIFKSGAMRPPTVTPSAEELKKIEAAVVAAGVPASNKPRNSWPIGRMT